MTPVPKIYGVRVVWSVSTLGNIAPGRLQGDTDSGWIDIKAEDYGMEFDPETGVIIYNSVECRLSPPTDWASPSPTFHVVGTTRNDVS